MTHREAQALLDTLGARELRRRAVYGRAPLGHRDSKGRCVPLRYRTAAKAAELLGLAPR